MTKRKAAVRRANSDGDTAASSNKKGDGTLQTELEVNHQKPVAMKEAPASKRCGRCNTRDCVQEIQVEMQQAAKKTTARKRKVEPANAASSVIYACKQCYCHGFIAGGFCRLGLSFQAWSAKCSSDEKFNELMTRSQS